MRRGSPLARALLLSSLVTFRAAAAEDAPLTALAVEAPGALCYSPQQRANIASHIVALDTENAELRESAKATVSPLVLVAVTVIAFGVGGAIGFAAKK